RTGEAVDQGQMNYVDGQQQQQSDNRAHFKRNKTSARRAQDVVIKFIFVIPKANPFAPEIVHGGGDSEKMFEELGRDVFVDVIFHRQLDRDSHQVQEKHYHPAGGVALL